MATPAAQARPDPPVQLAPLAPPAHPDPKVNPEQMAKLAKRDKPALLAKRVDPVQLVTQATPAPTATQAQPVQPDHQAQPVDLATVPTKDHPAQLVPKARLARMPSTAHARDVRSKELLCGIQNFVKLNILLLSLSIKVTR